MSHQGHTVYSGIALESQKDIVEEQFRKWKLPLKSLLYTVLKDPRLGGPAKGTLLIDSRGETPNVYVEDQLVFETKNLGSKTTASSTTGPWAAGSSKASSK